MENYDQSILFELRFILLYKNIKISECLPGDKYIKYHYYILLLK